ncbi:MAG: hypothetical protein AAF959_20325 [Cyanobacteria bacterium P01_D01_bin.56]
MSTFRVPKLPPTDDGEVSSLRYEVNPAIALNALTDLYKRVQQCQVKLRKLVQAIQQIYGEGPVVSGWLASEASLNAAVKYSSHSSHVEPTEPTPQPSPSFDATLNEADVALFRHGDADDLMNYLSALENSMLRAPETAAPPETTSQPEPSSQYYLCQLTSSGQIQAEPCPPEQVPVLSMAIARYRRLNQLTKQKQAIETKLQALLEILGDAQRVLADE